MISYGKIGQFRNVVRDISHTARFVGLDDDGEAIYDNSAKLPTIKFVATEKIHGTNGAVCYSYPDGMWFQSRKNIITPEKDNAGCAFFCKSKIALWEGMVSYLALRDSIDIEKHIISVYFEWCGGSIQPKSAFSGLDKRAYIFQHYKVSPIEPSEEENAYWLPVGDFPDSLEKLNEHNIFLATQFENFSFEIDFENPSLAQNGMASVVEDVIEPNSPAGKMLGIDGNVGEGIVCTAFWNGQLYRFKVKGEKHSKSKVKKLAKVDEATEQKKIDFVNTYACTSSRLEQAWQEMFGINNEKKEPSRKETGDFIRWVINDIVAEEIDIMVEMGLEPKMVNSKIANVAKHWFFEQLDKI